MKDATRILVRHPENPLIDIKDHPGIAQIFNPAPVRFQDETVLLVSVVDHRTARTGRDVGETRIARSRDGVHFELSGENFIPTGTEEYPWSITRHYIDNRVTKIGDTYYIITPVMLDGFDSPVGVLGKTRDFTTYERLDIITQPRNRGASLFPEQIDGMYYKLDRPGGGDGSNGDIWISSSPDLLHWGRFRPVLAANYKFWNMAKIGPTPPIRTDKGWLDIIHGVFTPAGGTYYYIAAILLDLREPWRVIGKTSSYLLKPDEEYERHGNCDNTVFPCGAIVDHDRDLLHLYYGAADCCICLATGSLKEVVDACCREL